MNILEAVPDSWIKASISRYCDVRLGKMLQNDPSSDSDELKSYLRAINIAKSGLDLSHEFSMWITPAEKDRFRLKNGDILVSEGGDAGRTAVFDSDREYYFQNAINRVRPAATRLIVPEFIYYWFTFLKAAGYVEMVCNVATIPHFTAEKVKAAPLALPSIKTQRRIARLLDEKTARIDGLIEKKRALLERLAEKRQALITRAVTKGLNPDAATKPSGVEWIGDIPAHWVVCGLGQKIKLQRGVDITKSERVDGEIPVVSSGGIDYFHDTALCDGPGVLIGRKGSAGKLHYVKDAYWPHDTTLYVREFRGNASRFVWYLLHCIDLTSFDTGSSNPTVNRNRVHPIQTAWPNSDEQWAIAIYLDRVLSRIAKIEESIEVSISHLVEYRSAVVAAAVIGKLDT
ncbi:restriction endonuclease subunit S [Rhizobium leguminosarum]|uniref:restriction endonuclease subunit S n=1 Tax=Rhizobium leguminosarum TaxID=384 RepID=UPI003F94D2A0